MGVEISGQGMRSTTSGHTAKRLTSGGWVLSWLPGRVLTRNQAVSGLLLADTAGDGLEPGDSRWPALDSWARELDLSGPEAVVRVSTSDEVRQRIAHGEVQERAEQLYRRHERCANEVRDAMRSGDQQAVQDAQAELRRSQNELSTHLTMHRYEVSAAELPWLRYWQNPTYKQQRTDLAGWQRIHDGAEARHRGFSGGAGRSPVVPAGGGTGAPFGDLPRVVDDDIFRDVKDAFTPVPPGPDSLDAGSGREFLGSLEDLIEAGRVPADASVNIPHLGRYEGRIVAVDSEHVAAVIEWPDGSRTTWAKEPPPTDAATTDAAKHSAAHEGSAEDAAPGAAEDDAGADRQTRPLDAGVAVEAGVEAEHGAEDVVISCGDCELAFDDQHDRAEASYLAGVHNDLHHAGRPAAVVVPVDEPTDQADRTASPATADVHDAAQRARLAELTARAEAARADAVAMTGPVETSDAGRVWSERVDAAVFGLDAADPAELDRWMQRHAESSQPHVKEAELVAAWETHHAATATGTGTGSASDAAGHGSEDDREFQERQESHAERERRLDWYRQLQWQEQLESDRQADLTSGQAWDRQLSQHELTALAGAEADHAADLAAEIGADVGAD